MATVFVFLFLFISFVLIICFTLYLSNFINEYIDVLFISNFGVSKLFKICIDFITLLVGLMLVICFIYVCLYTPHYFGGGVGEDRLVKMVDLFVVVMSVLICTRDFLSTLVFWEYLGVVRFFLILFYGSYLRLRSSIVTLISSRFGDVCLFLLIGFSLYFLFSGCSLAFLFFFIIFTKSAGFPFIRWLLEAMRAPTPVSSLVHSSTLVAAGVWFSMRYNLIKYFNKIFIFSVLLLLTVFITGVCCFFFVDLKKIVALSTCKKISWCVLYLIFGDVCLSLFQLITHGVAKCILFILVGDVMSGSGGSQSCNCLYSPYLYGNWSVFRISSIVLGLSGAPFIGVFFTKHAMLRRFNIILKISLFVMIMVCVFLSYFYSFRLCAVVFNVMGSSPIGVLFFFNSWMIGYLWLFVGFFVKNLIMEHYELSRLNCLKLIVFQSVSCIIAYIAYSSNAFSSWSRCLFGCDKIVELLYELNYSIVNILNLFIYRWDSYIIYLFRSLRNKIVKIYKKKMLKLLVYASVIFVMWFIIVC